MKILQLYYPDEHLKLPQEDMWAMDEQNLAFAVADAVHMLPGIEYPRGKNYPAPSPAGRLAREFCRNFIIFQKRSSIKDAFIKANRSVFHLNKKRDKFSVLLKAEAYYAATAVTGRIKGRTLEWRGICDSSISILDRSGRTRYFHTDHVHHHGFGPILRKYFHLDASYMFRTIFRNALSPEGKKLGYGVITGEKEAEAYAWFGKQTLHKGDVAVFATDGFEDYFKDASFRKALVALDRRRIEGAMEYSKKLHAGDRRFTLKSERTLIAVAID